ncbi:MAG TPA: thiamine diphosphokinase [Chondromyces sp.]|nr:thiamine diphosphokinase [Chondromyces sp.]
MKIAIMGGGPEENLPDLTAYNNEDTVWVGVDRGVYYLLERGIAPVVAFGDFDSVTKKEWEEIRNQVGEIKKFRPEKDETDMELALAWAMEQKPSEVVLLGATGGRLDHFFGNVSLLLKKNWLHSKTRICLVDNQNWISIYLPDTHSIYLDKTSKYISFFPVKESVSGLTLEGFKYPLSGQTVDMGSTLCISNELIGQKGTFSFTSGIIMVVRSRDRL